MKKSKYKEYNNKKNTIIVLIIITFILFIVSTLLDSIEEKEEDEFLTSISGVLETVKEAIEYYDCTYIKENKSSSNEFDTDIYVIFRHALYENDESNEEFYNKIIKAVGKVLGYKNFRMIDEENNINIEVICEGKDIKNITINGIENYFIHMDSQISLQKYTEIKETEITIDSSELINTINSNWNSQVDFGTRDSIFKSYYIYFDKGLETRKIGNKIYNIIFTKKYTEPVVSGIPVGTDFEVIERKLGIASFKNEDLGVIGYKGKAVYIFFTKDQISIYRKEAVEVEEFLKLADKLLSKEKDLKEFMNELTYLWSDYSEYIYDSNYFFISYPLKGIDIKYNYDNTSGIIFYNNFNANQKTISEYLENTEFIASLRTDNVFEAEQRRLKEKENLLYNSRNFKSEIEVQENAGESNIFSYYMDIDGNGNIITTYFISKDKSHANSEINENIYSYAWMGDNYFVYSLRNKGIYYYNVIDRTKGTILLGTDEYKIKGIDGGILKVDQQEIRIGY